MTGAKIARLVLGKDRSPNPARRNQPVEDVSVPLGRNSSVTPGAILVIRPANGPTNTIPKMGIPFTPASRNDRIAGWKLLGLPILELDYPRTFQEMDEWFRSDAACREYIQRLRWPDGFMCPECGVAGDPWMMSRGRLRCRACEWETSLTAGTVFQDTRKSLRTWFLAMWFVTSQKNGVSALGLQRVLGLGQLRNGLDLAPQAAASDGPAWSGLPHGHRRG